MRSLPAALFAVVLILVPGAKALQQTPPAGAATGGDSAPSVQALSPADRLPAHIISGFEEPIGFARTPSGHYLVCDRRAQAVYSVDSRRTRATRIVQVGEERGYIIRPNAFAVGPDGSFVVIDSPGGRARVQRFAESGYLLNGFLLPSRLGADLAVEGFVVGTVPSIQYTGDAVYISEPWTGALVTEYSWSGQTRRSFGRLRPERGETDREVLLALNAGLPLVDPKGGFYFVFQTGIPVFQKYDQAGTLVFERHIEGRTLDAVLRTQPEAWPKRVDANRREHPAVPLVVRTAAVDAAGRLWVVLDVGVIYVYSPEGEKIRQVQLRANDAIKPRSVFFANPSRMLVTPGCYVFDTASLGG